MTRAQARRLSGRLVDIERGSGWRTPPHPRWAGEPAKVLGFSIDLGFVVGWADEFIGWRPDATARCALFGDMQGCKSGWYVDPDEIDLLPPGAAVARGAR